MKANVNVKFEAMDKEVFKILEDISNLNTDIETGWNKLLSLHLVSCCFIVTNGKANIEVFNNEQSAIKLMKEYHKLGTPKAKQVHYIKKEILD